MGVPGFFAWLSRWYKKQLIQRTRPTGGIDILYLDANCLIHPECFRILKENPDWKSLPGLEKKMVNAVVQYIDHCIRVAMPKKKIFIAIDGVAPMAKVRQQRLRRFRSVVEHEEIARIKEKHGEKVPAFWSNAAITPGTEFMWKLKKTIEKNFLLAKEKYGGVEVVFSTANHPGEGEHKIMDDLRHQNVQGKNDSVAVYGLDADLIFLSLIQSGNRTGPVYLMREAAQVDRDGGGGDDGFCWVDVKALDSVVHDVFKKRGCDHPGVVNDFIFLCYFLGNDFIPALPSLDIYHFGIEAVLGAYKDAYEGHPLIIRNVQCVTEIDMIFFGRIVEKLARRETSVLRKDFEAEKDKKPKTPPRGDPTSGLAHDLWVYENTFPPHPNPIQLGSDKPVLWKKRYYQHYFEASTPVSRVCQDYMRGLLWTTRYYFDGCPSWRWFYHHDQGPFLSDLSGFLRHGKLRPITFAPDHPIDIILQLMIVLPQKLWYLLPPFFRDRLRLEKDLVTAAHPETFEMDYLYKARVFQALPVLPRIPLKEFIVFVAGIKKYLRETKGHIKEKGYLRTLGESLN